MLRELMACLLTLVMSTAALAVDFRIETKVYQGDEETPIAQTTTLCQNGVIYDFVEATKRVAIFHKARGDEPAKFLLMDPTRSIKTTFTTDRVNTFIEKLQDWSRTQSDPLLSFAADPDFDEMFDMESGILELKSPHVSYRLATLPVERTEAWPNLRNYFNAYAKLNCMLSSSVPTLARLAVNDALEKHNVVPVEVNLTIAGDESTQLRAEHLFTWRLSKDDRARIALVGEQLVSFRRVEIDEYQKDGVASK